MRGHIYCAVIDCYSDYVKVGCTINIHNRMNNLSSSHIDKFKCVFSIEVEQLNMYSIEKNIHQDIINAGFKRCKGREYFNCKPDDIKYIFDKYDNKPIKNNIIEEKLNEIKLETNQIAKKYICESCDFISNNKTNYTIHLQTQTHIKNITPENKTCCNKCFKIFNHKNSLYKHKKTCNNINNENNIENNNDNILDDPNVKILLLKQELKFKEIEKKLLNEKTKIESKLLKEKTKIESKLLKEKIEKELLKEFEKEKRKLIKENNKKLLKTKNNIIILNRDN